MEDYLYNNKCMKCDMVQYKLGLCFDHYNIEDYKSILEKIKELNINELLIKLKLCIINNNLQIKQIQNILHSTNCSTSNIYSYILCKKYPYLENNNFKEMSYENILKSLDDIKNTYNITSYYKYFCPKFKNYNDIHTKYKNIEINEKKTYFFCL